MAPQKEIFVTRSPRHTDFDEPSGTHEVEVTFLYLFPGVRCYNHSTIVTRPLAISAYIAMCGTSLSMHVSSNPFII